MADKAENGVSALCTTAIFSSPVLTEAGEPFVRAWVLPAGDLLRFERAHFFVTPEDIHSETDGATELEVALLLQGPATALQRERQGRPVLHGSAVAMSGGAVAFAAHSGDGKSGLAAALVQAGHPLLADDLVVLDPAGDALAILPGPASMRMWPDEAAHFVPDWESLPRVHPEIEKRVVAVGEGGWGAWCFEPRPLARLYLPDRRESDAEIAIEPVRGAEALWELARRSYLPQMVLALGLQPARLPILARAAQQGRLSRLSYPSGFEHLPRVVAAIEADLG